MALQNALRFSKTLFFQEEFAKCENKLREMNLEIKKEGERIEEINEDINTLEKAIAVMKVNV